MTPLWNAQDVPFWGNAAVFAGAGVIVWATGTRLARYVDGISGQTRLGHAVLGMLLLGTITSLPEVANVATSAVIGNPGLGINNLLGSAAINVLLLAIVDAFVGRDAATSVVVNPSTLMMGTLCTLLLIAVAAAVVVGDVPIFGVGLGAVLLCAASIVFFWMAAEYDKRAPWVVRDRGARRRGEPGAVELSFAALVWRTAIASVIIFAAGYSLSQTGDAIAEQTGIGSGMVGFALIGIATSLPELSAITAAFRIRRYEMAFGQVLGTNFINLALILLSDLCFAGGPVINELGRFEVLSALLGATVTGVLVIGLLERRNPTVMRMGYDSLAIIVLFFCGLGLLATIS
ncbi:MAG TPA: hypothetical protein VGD94_10395 [Vicinamibacterales bacterium]